MACLQVSELSRSSAPELSLAICHACPCASGNTAFGHYRGVIRHDTQFPHAEEQGDYMNEAKAWIQRMGPANVDGRHPAHVIEVTRADCVELLYRICESYEFSGETKCWCVVLLDRFLRAACRIPAAIVDPASKALVALARNASMVAITVFLVTCKFREVLSPHLRDLVAVTIALTGQRYTAKAIHEAEVIVLEATNWQLSGVTALDVCNDLLASCTEAQRSLLTGHIEFLCEVSCCCSDLLPYSTSSVAAAAFLNATERFHSSVVCSNILPSYMRTLEAEEASLVLKNYETEMLLRLPDEAAVEHQRDESHELPRSAMDMDDMHCDEVHSDLDSPVNADAMPNCWAASVY